jgi:hypothetical protein
VLKVVSHVERCLCDKKHCAWGFACVYVARAEGCGVSCGQVTVEQLADGALSRPRRFRCVVAEVDQQASLVSLCYLLARERERERERGREREREKQADTQNTDEQTDSQTHRLTHTHTHTHTHTQRER